MERDATPPAWGPATRSLAKRAFRWHHGAVGASAAERGWIGGRGWDLAFFFGGSALAVVAGAAMLARPALVVPFWWAWLLLADGPHLLATAMRSYADPEVRRRRRGLLLAAPLLMLPGLAAWALARATGAGTIFDLYLLGVTIWAYWHAVRQQYGILSIYQRHAGSDARGRKIDAAYLNWSLWLFYAVFTLGHPASRRVLQLPAQLPALAVGALVAIATALAAATIAYAVRVVLRWRAGLDVRPQLFVLLPVIACQAFALFVVGAHEPLFPRAANPEQLFLAAAVVGGLPHGVQYLGIVFAANRRRFAGDARRGALASLSRRPFIAWALLVVLSAGYLALNAARGSPAWSLFALDSSEAQLFLAVYWGLFLVHYWLDQYLWRVQGDRELRVELGLEPAT